MAKNIRVSDELYDYICSASNDGETIGNTVARLLDAEQSKGCIHTQDNHPPDLMPMEVYTYTILDAFRSMEECFHRTEYIWDGRLTAGHLQLKIEKFIAERGLLDWFTADAVVVSGRPRWEGRFTSALRQLVKDGCLEVSEDGYSRTEEGKGCLADISLHVNADAKQCYIVGFAEPIQNPDHPKQLEEIFVPTVLKE